MKAETRIAEMLERRTKRYVPPYSIALVCADLGLHQDAVAWLEKAYDDREVHMVLLRDHKWDGLRTMKGFQKLFIKARF